MSTNGGRGEGSRKILDSMLRSANVEFVLKCTRESVGKGLRDVLTLVFSRDLEDSPLRKNMARALLDLTGYKQFQEEIYFIPRNTSEYKHEFLAHHDGKIYATNLLDVVTAAGRLINSIQGIVDHPMSLAVCVSVSGLDYFDGYISRRQGNLLVIENPATLGVRPFSFYNTLYDETHGLKDWILIMKCRLVGQ